MEKTHICANCQTDLHVGVDALTVEKGVIGLKDFVCLDGPTFFCSEKCLIEYFDMSDLPSVPKRVP